VFSLGYDCAKEFFSECDTVSFTRHFIPPPSVFMTIVIPVSSGH
jgi:hypothetical protein